MIVAGNKNYGIAKEIFKHYPLAVFASRTTGFDLTQQVDQNRLANLIIEHDTFINCSALWKFQQTVLLDTIYKKCLEINHRPHIICIGSTTDRVKKGGSWLYNAEKKALRDYCNSLGLQGVWSTGPKITLISFGSLSNVQEKHPNRQCIPIDQIMSYINWVLIQPKNICINEISIDPMQDKFWYE